MISSSNIDIMSAMKFSTRCQIATLLVSAALPSIDRDAVALAQFGDPMIDQAVEIALDETPDEEMEIEIKKMSGLVQQLYDRYGVLLDSDIPLSGDLVPDIFQQKLRDFDQLLIDQTEIQDGDDTTYAHSKNARAL